MLKLSYKYVITFIISLLLSTSVAVRDGYKVGAKEIYERYVEWCDMGRQKKGDTKQILPDFRR